MPDEEILTEEKIFKAASEVFEEKGMTGTRMQDIASRAGINKALLHYYFRTKEKLFLAVFNKLAEKMFAKFAVILEDDVPVKEKVEYFFAEHISFLQKNPKLPVFILVETGRNPELIHKIISNIDFSKIKDSLKRTSLSKFSDHEIAHLMVSIISLSVFPVAAKPIIGTMLSSEGIDYNDFIEERKAYSADLIIRYINSVQNGNN